MLTAANLSWKTSFIQFPKYVGPGLIFSFKNKAKRKILKTKKLFINKFHILFTISESQTRNLKHLAVSITTITTKLYLKLSA